MISWEEYDRPSPGLPAQKRICQTSPPNLCRVRSVKEIASAEDGIDVVLMRQSEDSVDYAQTVTGELPGVLGLELPEGTAYMPVRGVKDFQHVALPPTIRKSTRRMRSTAGRWNRRS